MNQDCFYEGLNPEYQCMLAHKVGGEHPTSYSNLLLAAWKMERWAEARDPLLPKTTTMRGSNVTWPQTSGNLFPTRKLQGNCTFKAQSAIMESIGTEEEPSVKPEGEEEMESSDGEDPEISSWIGGAHQLIGYIVCLPLWSSCIRRKTEIVSDVVVLTTSLEIVWRISARLPKCERRDGKERRLSPSETSSCSTGIPGWGSQGLKTSHKVPFLNSIPLNWWSGLENIAWIWINSNNSWALLESDSTINVVTQEFVELHSLDVGPLSNLSNGTLGINAIGGVFSWPLGCVIIRVQVEGIQGYYKDQVALIVPDSTGFGPWIPVILCTPTMNQIINMIKESKIYELTVFLNESRIAWF